VPLLAQLAAVVLLADRLVVDGECCPLACSVVRVSARAGRAEIWNLMARIGHDSAAMIYPRRSVIRCLGRCGAALSVEVAHGGYHRRQ